MGVKKEELPVCSISRPTPRAASPVVLAPMGPKYSNNLIIQLIKVLTFTSKHSIHKFVPLTFLNTTFITPTKFIMYTKNLQQTC